MISRSTVIGALVVAELTIVGLSVSAIAGTGPSSGFSPPHLFPADSNSAVTSAPRFDRTLETSAAPHIVIDVHDVNVTIDGSQRGSVHATESVHLAGFVTGTLAPIEAAPIGDGIRISARGGNVQVMLGELSRTLRIAVPEGARVEVLSAGRIDVSGMRNKLVAHTPDGQIHVRDHRGDLAVSSDSGRIELIDVHGADVAADTHEGRLYFTRVDADRIDGHSNYGRIYAVDVRARDGALSTHSGRISASFTGQSDATVSVSTRDGDVTVSGLPSTPSGKASSIVRLGAGTGRFEVSTDEGDVNISQGASV
jgi:hypothetical protein